MDQSNCEERFIADSGFRKKLAGYYAGSQRNCDKRDHCSFEMKEGDGTMWSSVEGGELDRSTFEGELFE